MFLIVSIVFFVRNFGSMVKLQEYTYQHTSYNHLESVSVKVTYSGKLKDILNFLILYI